MRETRGVRQEGLNSLHVMRSTRWVGTAAIVAIFVAGGMSSGRANEETDGEALLGAHDLNERVVKLWRARKYAEAEPLARQALAIWERVHGPDHPETSHGLRQVGAQLLGLRRYDDAVAVYQRSLRIREALHGSEHSEVARDLVYVAMAEEGRLRLEAALGHLKRALSIYEARGGARTRGWSVSRVAQDGCSGGWAGTRRRPASWSGPWPDTRRVTAPHTPASPRS